MFVMRRRGGEYGTMIERFFHHLGSRLESGYFVVVPAVFSVAIVLSLLGVL